ncbi:hypothetical protein HR45_07300 [Shewanella mangrovi]|uniref:Cyclic nucleotide-binding domain-containing protein n=1 Tax=Shewanella mangrovi TaxID=1515746 RepID=A0A094LSW9_9GAMM|nr:hypothetical protein HR45_07300 [Shewanella mangrovi]
MSSIIARFPKFIRIGRVVHFKRRETLLNDGDVCQNVFIIEKGIVRSWFNGDGDDVTFQFYFAGDVVEILILWGLTLLRV